MSQSQKTIRWEVPAKEAGERLDRLLVDHFPAQSRARLQAWIKAGGVLLDGSPPVKGGVRVEVGQRIEVTPPTNREPISAEEAQGRLNVVHEEDAFLVIDKPAGLLTHSAPSAEGEVSLAEIAQALYPGLPTLQGEDRPGIVHRLDRDTSGLIVIARNEPAMETLMQQFAERRVKKQYLAFVHGVPRFDTEWIEKPIGRSARQPDRQSVVPEGEGRSAETFYEVLETYDRFAYLACTPKTGRTHQIRVHLASVELPIVGDTVYRKRGALERPLPDAAPSPGRQALHAAELAFESPVTGEKLQFRSSLPPELAALRDWLHADAQQPEE